MAKASGTNRQQPTPQPGSPQRRDIYMLPLSLDDEEVPNRARLHPIPGDSPEPKTAR